MPFPRKTLLTLMAAMAITGCSTSGSDKQESAPPATFDGRCNADNARAAIGQQATADLLEQSRVKAGAQVARVLKPHDMVTLEYRSDRLNLNADDSGKITRVNCG
ncbi:I78 family peptidase inhibitor [Pseudomonas sp. UBA4194]|uniref:I78 family peptidase inhibitor n=1 Tax=Pseudomonas sp. UBA4194 TaxID=1947317 RepID=UPI0025E3B155|nr:I78 family peptidase inhibitor [Pseudomonas sp. UBA4194]